MRNRFPGYYRPSDDDFAELWKECLFVPDTNILLHLFRFGEKTRTEVLDTLAQLKPRVWIPYRVGFEFQRRWRDVDRANRDAYERLEKDIRDQGHQLEVLFDKHTRHQTIDAKQEKRAIEQFIDGLCRRLNDNKTRHPTENDAAQIFTAISDLVGDAVGERPPQSRIEELVKDGQKRYELGVPPGNADAKAKQGVDKYGDFLLWNEILEKAKAIKKPMVVVTDDVKEDWWLEFHGAKLGPRPELVQEMLDYADQKFYLYTLSQFLDYASVFLKRKVDVGAIEEIKSDEREQRQAAQRVRQHRVPVTLVNRLVRTLVRKQSDLLRRRRHIDAEISALGELQSENYIQTIQALLKERRDITQEIAKNTRKARFYRNEGRKYVMVTPAENLKESAVWGLLPPIEDARSAPEVDVDASDDFGDAEATVPSDETSDNG